MAPSQIPLESFSSETENVETSLGTNGLNKNTISLKSTNGKESQVNSSEPDVDNTFHKDTSMSKSMNIAIQDEPAETFTEADNNARHSQYDHLGEALFEKERKSGDLALRSKQAVLHLTFTEMRISRLEEELRTLKAKISGVPDELTFGKRLRQCSVPKPVLKRSTGDEFRLTSHSKDTPINQRPALESLVTEFIPQPSIYEEPQKPVRRSTGLIGVDQELNVSGQTPERLRIRSMPLIAHLERICRELLSNHWVWSDTQKEAAPVVLLRPFKLLVAYEKEIKESIQDIKKILESTDENGDDGKVKKGTCNSMEFEYENLLQDLNLLIDFINVDLKPTFDLRQSIKDGKATHIEYADLWHLFEIGDIVVTRSNKMQAFRVINFTGGRDKLISLPDLEKAKKKLPGFGFTIDCCRFSYNGTSYVPEMETFSIRKFSGRRLIKSLEVYPLKFHDDSDSLRQELLSQGRQYLELTRSPFSHKSFKGKTLDEPPQDLDAQVIVDIALAITAKPEWRQNLRISENDLVTGDPRETQMPPFCDHDRSREGCCGSDFIFKDQEMNCPKFNPSGQFYGDLSGPRDADDLEDEDLMLLPAWVYAFVLRSRQWVTVKMVNLSEVQFKNNFDELMFSDNHKQTILALVSNHETARTLSETETSTVGTALDLVKGKGTGLIILLHGEPGVGKTSTAECIADKTQRPLFPITCGDIGETGLEVERNLYHNFRLAHKWGCVLLLDEADVFLAKRNKTDLRRNAVTSVFLRSLEYYAGILFLTTNRVGGIDPAFKSRLHLSLYYPRISLDITMNLYEVFLRRTREEQQRSGVVKFRIKDKEILKFAKRHHRQLEKEGYNTWNGRQIRNAFQTAIALVEHEAANNAGQPKPQLGKKQFETVAQGSREFDSYLLKVLQAPDDEMAVKDGWRADRFDTGVTPNQSSVLKSNQKGLRGLSQVAISSESEDSEDTTDSEDEDDAEEQNENIVEAKSKAAVSGLTNQAKLKGRDESRVDMEEFEEFLRYKSMLSGKTKKP